MPSCSYPPPPVGGRKGDFAGGLDVKSVGLVYHGACRMDRNPPMARFLQPLVSFNLSELGSSCRVVPVTSSPHSGPRGLIQLRPFAAPPTVQSSPRSLTLQAKTFVTAPHTMHDKFMNQTSGWERFYAFFAGLPGLTIDGCWGMKRRGSVRGAEF